MMSKYIRSTVAFLSNLQPLETSPLNDMKYLSHIHDPFALEYLEKKARNGVMGYRLSSIQRDEYEKASIHCSYAAKDDFPWGTQGTTSDRRLVCLCTNTSCLHFKTCRPKSLELTELEQSILDENRRHSQKTDPMQMEERVVADHPKNRMIESVIMPITSEPSTGGNESARHIEIQVKGNPVTTENKYESDNNIVDKRSLANQAVLKVTPVLPVSREPSYETTNVSEETSSKSLVNHLPLILTAPSSHDVIGLGHDPLSLTEKVRSDDSGYPTEEYPGVRQIELPLVETNIESHTNPSVSCVNTTEAYEGRGFHSFIVAEQKDVIHAPASDRVIVNAGPGTGKTWTIIKRLYHLVESEGIEPENIVVLCFSRAAVSVINERLRQEVVSGIASPNLLAIVPRTFDSFATLLLCKALVNIPESLPHNFEISDYDYDGRIEQAIKLLCRKAEVMSNLKHFIVDEVQDLVACRARLIMRLLLSIQSDCGFTLLGDACQSIYDYQVKGVEHEVDSVAFYSWLFQYMESARLVEFRTNYRQNDEMISLCDTYRDVILRGNPDGRSRVLSGISAKISGSDKHIVIDQANHEALANLSDSGSTAILCRTNAQALRVSFILKNGGIIHDLRCQQEENHFADWVGRFFALYPHESINKAYFYKQFNEMGSLNEYLDCDECWNALIHSQPAERQTHRVADILRGLVRDARDPVLFGKGTTSPLTVSVIHRAKGGEFDNVIIHKESLPISGLEKEQQQEHKVRYVAFTRARNRIVTGSFPNFDIRTFQAGGRDGDTRRYRTFSRRGSSSALLTHIEVGLKNDVNQVSFAETDERQSYIQSMLSHGDGLEIHKRKKDDGDTTYDIIHSGSDRMMVIGEMGIIFVRDQQFILKSIYGLAKPAEYKDMGICFVDMYIDKVITRIATIDKSGPGAKVFGDMCVWNGLLISGFAHLLPGTH